MLVEGLQGDEDATIWANDKYDEVANYKTSGGANEELVNKGLEISLIGDKNLLVQNDRERYGDREDHLREKRHANDDKVSSNECLRLDKQLMENKRTWELAKESGAMLYKEEDDIIAILQE
ncbi:hypothetical protein AHAS_Ahas02G0218300 [Arachis hypogaea]